MRTMDLLVHHPCCRQFRLSNPLGLKLLDIPLLEGAGALYVDSDVYFFRPFTCEALRQIRSEFVFMRDSKEGYSARIMDLIHKHRLDMPSRVNSGIIWIPHARYNLDFIEWFLGKLEFRLFPTLVEQTCWAAMARSDNVWYVSPTQIPLARRDMGIEPNTVATHFYGKYKGTILDFVRLNPARLGVTPHPLILARVPRLGWGRMVINTLKNRLGITEVVA